MKYFFRLSIFSLVFASSVARADLWGGDLPLLAEIVTNTLNTLYELQKQSKQWQEEMDGIGDKINRIQTIANIVNPNSWDQWKDPAEAMNRLQRIYYTIPKEYRTEKSDQVEQEISKAMNMVARIQRDTQSTFLSGKELEARGADASPGVAQKLTASGVGTLISQQAQAQVIQSQIASLLSQMLANGNEQENRAIVAHGTAFQNIAAASRTSLFSQLILGSKEEK
jgi:hypothetical protein